MQLRELARCMHSYQPPILSSKLERLAHRCPYCTIILYGTSSRRHWGYPNGECTTLARKMSLVAPTEHLQQALASIHQASTDFTNPDPHLRAKGEATFLALRQSDGALDYACFALQHSQDALVLFQSLNTVLFVLPHLPLNQPSQSIGSLVSLRDFLLHFCVSRSEHAAQSTGTHAVADNTTSWPQYTRNRAFQAAIAVEKRVLGLELAQHVGESAGGNSDLATVINNHVGLLNTQLSSLLTFPAPWPTSPTEAAVALARIVTGLGLVRAVVDEFILTATNDLSDTGAADRSDRDRRQSSGASVSKSAAPGSAVGLNLLQHRQCKSLIQNHVLTGLMTATFQLLYSTISNTEDPTFSQCRSTLFSQAASTAEKLLGWSFTRFDPFTSVAWQQQAQSAADDTALVYGVDEDEDQPTTSATSASGPASSSSKLYAQSIPDAFVPVLLTDDVVSLLSAAYRFGVAALSNSQASRDITYSVDRLKRCILSVCSFMPQFHKPQHVPVLTQRTKHLCTTLQTLVQEECSTPSPILSARCNSMLFLAQCYQTVIAVTPVQILATALRSHEGTEGSIGLVSSLSALGKKVFELAFHRPKDTDEEDDLVVLTEDAVDTLLGCWQALTAALRSHEPGHENDHDVQILARAIHGSIRDQVFGPYVTGRLEAAATVSEDDDVSEIGEATGKDRDIYSDQLITIASLGRSSAADNLRALQHLAHPLCEKLSAKAQGRISIGDVELGQAWEQIHWLVLIAGHLLADDAKGETPEIPREIAASSEPEDPAVALIMQLGMHLLQHLSSHGPASAQATSPQVTETLLWFTGRWTSTYLLIDERAGFATNASIQQTFGGDAGRQVLTFLLQRMSENLQLWLTDSDVLVQLAQVLSAFTRSSGIMICLLQLPEMEHLVSAIVSGLDHLPANTHGVLVSSVVSCIYSGATHVDNATERSAEGYFKQITASIEQRFGSLLSRSDFASIAQRSDVISAIQTSLDMLEGLASSIQPNSAETVYGFISKFFPAFAELCRTYDTRPEIAVSVLRVIKTLCSSLELDFGAESFIVMGLNSAVWELCHALQGHNRAGKKKSHLLLVSEAGSPLEDEEPYEGLCLLLEILCELSGSAKAGVDDGGSDQDLSLQPNKTSDVCLLGFDHTLGLLDAEPLTVPRVRQAFGRLVSAIFSQFSGRLILLSTAEARTAGGAGETPAGLLDRAVQALSLCIKMDETETAQMGLESVLALGKTVSAHFAPLAPDGKLTGALHTCLGALLRLVFAEPLDSSLMSTALLSLLCLLQLCRDTDLNRALSAGLQDVENQTAFQTAIHEVVPSALAVPPQTPHAQWIHEIKPKVLRWRGQIRIR
ncbi:hypothetical protein BCV70DRAFT_220770 [Testicularia cyperi]|uniref:Exportin-4 n=1 Tax=Testicularia cyperi TaxID=1882483 RepID=A0A317XLZ9_9BASI|nr:hypothetical protein BCV70DRAFT_220770 [Testicularia cyperi]